MMTQIDNCIAAIVIGIAIGYSARLVHEWLNARRQRIKRQREIGGIVEKMRKQRVRTFRVTEHVE